MMQVFILLLSLSAFAGDRLEIIKIGHPTLADPKFQKLVDNMITTMVWELFKASAKKATKKVVAPVVATTPAPEAV